jgi:hypothetical protein
MPDSGPGDSGFRRKDDFRGRFRIFLLTLALVRTNKLRPMTHTFTSKRIAAVVRLARVSRGSAVCVMQESDPT